MSLTEQQPYQVPAQHADFELRRYPEHLVAETEVGGSFELAGNLAFPRLARYIKGDNRAARKIAMTAPVVQERAPVEVVGAPRYARFDPPWTPGSAARRGRRAGRCVSAASRWGEGDARTDLRP